MSKSNIHSHVCRDCGQWFECPADHISYEDCVKENEEAAFICDDCDNRQQTEKGK